jgi:hypothetical protein
MHEIRSLLFLSVLGFSDIASGIIIEFGSDLEVLNPVEFTINLNLHLKPQI